MLPNRYRRHRIPPKGTADIGYRRKGTAYTGYRPKSATNNPFQVKTIHNHKLLASCRPVAVVDDAGRTRNSLAHWEKEKGDLDEGGATPGDLL